MTQGAERGAADVAYCAAPHLQGKEEEPDGVAGWPLHPPLLIEIACCLLFAATIVVVGCIYILATNALLPMILQIYELIW